MAHQPGVTPRIGGWTVEVHMPPGGSAIGLVKLVWLHRGTGAQLVKHTRYDTGKRMFIDALPTDIDRDSLRVLVESLMDPPTAQRLLFLETAKLCDEYLEAARQERFMRCEDLRREIFEQAMRDACGNDVFRTMKLRR